MRKVIGGAFISLDGVVQAPGGPEEDTTGGFAHGGWIWPVSDEAVFAIDDALARSSGPTIESTDR